MPHDFLFQEPLQEQQQLARRISRAKHNNHRCPLIFTGNNNQLMAQLGRLVKHQQLVTPMLYSDQPCWSRSGLYQVTPWKRAKHALGQTTDTVIVDLTERIPADALGIISGTVRGSGLCVLLCPPAYQWPQVSAFHQRAHRILQQFSHADTEVDSVPPHPTQALALPSCYATADQQRAVEEIKRVKIGHRRRPLVLTADRGRGKSAALGIAAAELMREASGLTIIATAPALATTTTLFLHAAQTLPGCVQTRGSLLFNHSQLLFMAPDELARSHPKATLILVDEAAALPAPLLTRLLKGHARIVFASTIHGYEGTGRGFAIRFQKTLDQLTPKWRRCQMHQPIRWSEHDPLEALINKLLLLDSKPTSFNSTLFNSTLSDSINKTIPAMAEVQYRPVTKQQLSSDEQRLSQIFGLLISAHYQTHPDDLQQIMDRDDLELVTLTWRGDVVAAMLISYEGGFDQDLAREVWAGRRRLKGHLLPQTLAAHAGLQQATELTMARIMRLAVHPQLQGQGLGQELVSRFASGLADNVDILGSCFGATEELLNFWQYCTLQPVHIGSTRNAASGCYNAAVVKATSPRGVVLCQQAHRRFAQALPALARQTLTMMESEILLTLLAGVTGGILQPEEREQLQAFVTDRLPIDRILPELIKLLTEVMPKYRNTLPTHHQTLLTSRFIQNRSWEEAIAESGITGKREAESTVLESVRLLLK